MAGYLYRVGKFCFRRKWIVGGTALLLLLLMITAAATMARPTSDAFSIPGIPSERAMTLMDQRFPDDAQALSPDAATAKFVMAAPSGQTLNDPRNAAAVQAVIDKVKALPQLSPGLAEKITNPVLAAQATMKAAEANAALPAAQRNPAIPSPENVAALLPLNLEPAGGFPAQAVTFTSVTFGTATQTAHDVTDHTRDAIAAAAQVGRDGGLTVYATGSAVQVADGSNAGELVGIGVAAVVLAITFGALVAAGLPLLTALIGVAIGSLAITAASGIWELSTATPTLATMIGLAVAVDYALFIVSRYKHELTLTADREEAAGRAVGTAGSAVVFAGLTVFIALVALSVVRIPFLTAMGLAAAFTVLIAVLIALTLLPAVLGMVGGKVFAGKVPGISGVPAPEETSRAVKYVRTVVRFPAVAMLVGIVLLAVVAVPALKLDLALPSDGSADPGTAQREAYDLVSQGFGVGRNGPLIVVADGRGVAPANRVPAFGAVAQRISAIKDVRNAQVVNLNPAGDTALIQVIPRSGPTEAATQGLVDAIRAAEGQLTAETGGVRFGVTGQTAIQGDVSARLSSSLLPYLLIVVGLAFLLLMLVFRSIVVPLTAALGFLLSVAATFGATVAIFQLDIFGLTGNPQPIVSFLPIFLIGVVFGLAMDYQVFLVSRMRESYTRGHTPKDAVIKGFHDGSRVVLAAAVIMVAVFGAFISQPGALIKSIGFALAVAVIFDAFVVRMLIIPAAMALLGQAAWWLPRWLDKALPNIDIEGEKLTAAHPVEREGDPEPVPV